MAKPMIYCSAGSMICVAVLFPSVLLAFEDWARLPFSSKCGMGSGYVRA